MLTELRQFQSWLQAAKLQHSVSRRRSSGVVSETKGSDGEPADVAMKTVNAMLFQKLKTIFSAILDAAVVSNNW